MSLGILINAPDFFFNVYYLCVHDVGMHDVCVHAYAWVCKSEDSFVELVLSVPPVCVLMTEFRTVDVA